MRVYVDGAKVQQLAGPAAQEAAFEVANNLGPHAVMLEVCNEKGACTQSSVQNVQTYGPLAPSNIHSITPTINVTAIAWTIEVDSNGDPATVTVTSDKWRTSSSTSRSASPPFTTQPMDFGYQETETVTVTLSDASARPGRRCPAPTRPPPSQPPPPTVVARREVPPATTTRPPACRRATPDSSADRTCTDASCALREHHAEQLATDVPRYGGLLLLQRRPGRPYDPNAVSTPRLLRQPRGTVTVYVRERPGSERQHPVHLVTAHIRSPPRPATHPRQRRAPT